MRRLLVALAATAPLSVAAPAAEFEPAKGSATSLLDLARRLAAVPYAAPGGQLPPPFAGLSYDEYRAIRPIPGRSALLTFGPGWAADLMPPGLYFPDPVIVELPAEGGGFEERSFTPALFDFDPHYFEAVPDTAPGAGFSGLRVRYPLNAVTTMDEVMVMQGASYFRAVGRAMVYGLSARGVAIGTGGPGPEEFPRFTRVRLHRPDKDELRLEAVMDSASLAGHISMVLRPGRDTEMDIVATLLPRREIADIGVAPLTSMFLKGPMRAAVSDDYRPRVHDSNVLAIENGAGEKLWRPLANPARIESSAFLDSDPVAFGLWQTARRFGDFEDGEARYHDRPSARVVPADDWGVGAVVLVEIPTGDEFMDNVVAFWRPERPLLAHAEYRFAYRIVWTRGAPWDGPLRSILQSRSGREHDRPGTRRFVVDIEGPGADLLPDLSASEAVELSSPGTFPLPDGRGSRVTFLLRPGDRDTVDLRLVLRNEVGAVVSPVWLYRWTRARDGGV